MTALKIYKNGNYLIIEDSDNNRFVEDLLVNVRCTKNDINSVQYFIYLDYSRETIVVEYPYIVKQNNVAYASQTEWETFIFGNTGVANCTTSGGGGSGATNLSYTASPTDGTVNSDTGTDAVIPLVTTVNAGLQSPTDKTKLDGIQAGAEVNVNADWLAVSGDALILNKPTSLPTSNVAHSVKYAVALTKGQAVYVSGADGTNMLVSKADYSTEATSSKTLGLVTATGSTNYQGQVITEGLLAGLDTSTATIGDAVWLGDDGNLLYGLANKPISPNNLVFIGIVTRVNANNGEIFVKVQNGFEIEELHDVLIQSPVNKDILYRDSATSLWKNGSITSVLGYTPTNQTRQINTTTPLQGGGDLTADRTLSITQATTTTDGYLSSTDWNIFNVKLDKNIPRNRQNASYTLQLSDRAKLIEIDSATANTLTIPASVFSSGDQFLYIPYGVGATTITAGVGVTINSGTGTYITSSRYGIVSIIAISATEFYINGNLTSSSAPSNDLLKFHPSEFFRGSTFNNNSTTVTAEGGVTISTTASTLAQSVSATAFNLKNIRLKYMATVVSTGRYTGVRGSALLWYIGGGFRFVCSFSVSDTAFGSACRQFYGLAGQTADLGYTDAVLVASLTNIIGIGSDALDTNLQVFTNDATGTATKIDLGANFPANRTAGSAMSTIYQIQIYNPSGSATVRYKVVNLETGNTAEGSITTDLPAQTQGLNFFASRCMGSPTTGTGEFFLYNKFGVYSVA